MATRTVFSASDSSRDMAPSPHTRQGTGKSAASAPSPASACIAASLRPPAITA